MSCLTSQNVAKSGGRVKLIIALFSHGSNPLLPPGREGPYPTLDVGGQRANRWPDSYVRVHFLRPLLLKSLPAILKVGLVLADVTKGHCQTRPGYLPYAAHVVGIL